MSLLNQQRKHIDIPPPDPHYPAYRFHQDGRTMVVKAKHLEPTEPGWGLKPVPQPEPVEVTPEARIAQLERELAQAKAETDAQRKKFDEAWEGLTAEFKVLQEQLVGTTEGQDQALQASADSTAAVPAHKSKKGK